MKSLLVALSVSSLVYGAPFDGNELEDRLVEFPLTKPGMPVELNEMVEANFVQPVGSELAMPEGLMEKKMKSPMLAVSLSYLVPGLGHMYLEDWKTASGLLGSALAGVGATFAEAISTHQLTTMPVVLQTVWWYGIYAAYRDTRNFNGQSEYKYQMPKEDFADLTYAPFRWSVWKKPEVWGGVLGSLALGLTLAYLTDPGEAEMKASGSREQFPLVALPVAIGEESFFRGYLQSQLSESLTPWGGIALSSAIFGLAHVPNAMMLEPHERKRYYTVSVPFITGMGAYMGWLTHKNHSLKESVAVHMWYDFILFAMSYAASKAVVHAPTSVGVAIPF